MQYNIPMDSKLKRPKNTKIICILMFIGFSLFLLTFIYGLIKSIFTTTQIILFPILAIISFIGVIALWNGKKIGAIIVISMIILNQIISIFIYSTHNYFSIGVLIVFIVLILNDYKYLK